MYDITQFSLSDMTECASALRQFGVGAKSMEEVADGIARFLYDHLIIKQSGERGCALVRVYKTHPFRELTDDLRDFACGVLGRAPESADVKCLTLLGTAGDLPDWNVRSKSVGHQAIPLPSERVVAQFPMISQLINQFGLDISAVLRPDPAHLIQMEKTEYNVFLASDAAGNPYIPAHDEFVIPHRIESALGFGGMLPSGNLYAVILFSKCSITRATANMFQTLALSVKMAVLPFENAVFASP